MIGQLNKALNYTQAELNHLNNLVPHSKDMWDKPPDDDVKLIKTRIRQVLLVNQSDICGYCGLDLGGTSEGQIEHIAPKAKYPQFTFEKDNLVMACHYCNGFSKKGNHHTIHTLNPVYNLSAFKLVHPYFDDHSSHYEWVSQNRKILIKGISVKGKYSIKIFKLDELKLTELRAKKVIAEIVLASVNTPQIDDALIQQTINYTN
jgi:uncharacterized protein (TIGR02646 family)